MRGIECLAFGLLAVSCTSTTVSTPTGEDGGAAGAPEVSSSGGLSSSGGMGGGSTETATTGTGTAGPSSGGTAGQVTIGGIGGGGAGGIGGGGDLGGATSTDTTTDGGAGGSSGGGSGGTGGGGTGGVPPLPDGEACGESGECESGYCVDGYCCNSDCTGQCESCAESGLEGTCSPRAGEPLSPRAGCAGTGMCAGECDGVDGSACLYPDDSSVCSDASCSAGVVTTASVCNGSGACTESGTAECPGMLCADDGSAACDTSCTPTSCASNQYCDVTGACVAKRGNGESCSSESECTSGNCVDGTCCNDACDGQCESCNESGSVGTCQVRTGAPLATRPACPGSGACRALCDGDDGDACSYPGSETVCATATCSGGMSTPESTCNGAGSCPSQTPVQCPGNRCLGGECADCTQSSCTADTYCSGSGACVAKKGDNSSCDGDVECQSDNCSIAGGDGICCASDRDNCGGSCIDQSTNEEHCGACNNECDHDRTCTGGTCTCNGYTLPSSCGGCGLWTFETGSPEGWVVDTENPTFSGDWNAVSNVIQSQAQEHGGSYSVAASFLVDINANQVSVMTPLCSASGGSMNIGGFTVSFWARYTGTGELNVYSFLWVDAWGDTDSVRTPALFGVNQFPKDTWVFADVTFTESLDAHHLAIRLGTEVGNFTGTLYLDDIQITGP